MESSASTSASERANELYWGSDWSVNQIADELDLSKGALYGMIRPLPAALGCPECGAGVVHPNRTAKDRGILDCPDCGWTGPEATATVVGARMPASRSRMEGRTLLGGTLLGTAAGLALVLWARRR